MPKVVVPSWVTNRKCKAEIRKEIGPKKETYFQKGSILKLMTETKTNWVLRLVFCTQNKTTRKNKLARLPHRAQVNDRTPLLGPSVCAATVQRNVTPVGQHKDSSSSWVVTSATSCSTFGICQGAVTAAASHGCNRLSKRFFEFLLGFWETEITVIGTHSSI